MRRAWGRRSFGEIRLRTPMRVAETGCPVGSGWIAQVGSNRSRSCRTVHISCMQARGHRSCSQSRVSVASRQVISLCRTHRMRRSPSAFGLAGVGPIWSSFAMNCLSIRYTPSIARNIRSSAGGGKLVRDQAAATRYITECDSQQFASQGTYTWQAYLDDQC